MIDRFTFNFSEKRTQHSHVQINKAIIENFSFYYEDPQTGDYHSKTTGVFSLNLQTKEITITKPKKTGTIFGYFSDEDETKLSVDENHFFEIVNQNIDINNYYYELQSNKDVIINFVNLLLNRSEKRQSVMKGIAKYFFQKNYGGSLEKLSKFPITIELSKLIDQNHGVTVLVNHTDKNLVLPRNGFYCVNYAPNEKIYIFPIMPKKALVITNNLALSSHILDINDPIKIYNLNIGALKTEMSIDNSVLISKTIDELQDMKSFLESKEGELYVNFITHIRNQT